MNPPLKRKKNKCWRDNEEIKGEKTVGSVVKSRTIGPGHDKFNASLDKMVANNTLHPEDADILKDCFFWH